MTIEIYCDSETTLCVVVVSLAAVMITIFAVV